MRAICLLAALGLFFVGCRSGNEVVGQEVRECQSKEDRGAFESLLCCNELAGPTHFDYVDRPDVLLELGVKVFLVGYPQRLQLVSASDGGWSTRDVEGVGGVLAGASLEIGQSERLVALLERDVGELIVGRAENLLERASVEGFLRLPVSRPVDVSLARLATGNAAVIVSEAGRIASYGIESGSEGLAMISELLVPGRILRLASKGGLTLAYDREGVFVFPGRAGSIPLKKRLKSRMSRLGQSPM